MTTGQDAFGNYNPAPSIPAMGPVLQDVRIMAGHGAPTYTPALAVEMYIDLDEANPVTNAWVYSNSAWAQMT